MLYPDVLLPFTAITLKRLDLSSEGAQQLHCEVPISFPPKERLRFLLAAQRGDDSGMRCHHLCRQHPLDFVLGADTRYRRQYFVDDAFARWIFPAPIARSANDAVKPQLGMSGLRGAEGGHETCALD